jgi:hypothetical protein
MAENHQYDSLGPAVAQAREPRAPVERFPRAAAWAAPALLILLILGMYWKLVLTDEYTWLESPDLAHQVLPWFQYQAGEWHAGRFPLWDPYHWGGQPLIGQAQPGAAYPLNWLLFALPLHHGWLKQIHLHWYFVVIHIMAALGAYALSRDIGASRLAAVLGGAAFSLSGYVGSVDWPQMLNASVWIPLVFLFVLRALRGVRPVASAVLGGFFLGVAWLAGHHQIPIFTSLAAGAVWLVQIAKPILSRDPSTLSRDGMGGYFRAVRPAVVCAAVFFITAGATGALQTLPALEYGRLAKRWVGVDDPVGWSQPVPYKVHKEYSMNPSSLAGVLLIGKQRMGEPFTGVVLLALAIAAVAAGWRRVEVRVLTGVAAGGIALALGSYGFLQGLLYAVVPMVEKARSPHTAIHLFTFAVSILAAVGLDAVLESRSAPWVGRGVKILGWSALGLAVGVLYFLLDGKLNGDDRIALAPLAAGALAAILAGWRRGALGGAVVGAGVSLLVLTELGAVLGFFWFSRYEKDRPSYLAAIRDTSDIAEYLYSRPEPVRIVRYEGGSHNFGDMYGIPEQGGYLASITANLLSQQLGGDHVWNLFGVNYSVAKEKFRPEQELVFQSRSGLKVFRDPGAFPRAFSVHAIKEVDDPYALRVAFDDRQFDLRHSAILFRPGGADRPHPQQCAAGLPDDDVRLELWQPNRVRVGARMACQGLVVVGDTWYPGWKATVDGQPARIWEVDGLVRAIEVPAGTHAVEMVYRPASVYLGAALTALAALAAVAAGWTGRKSGQTQAKVLTGIPASRP